MSEFIPSATRFIRLPSIFSMKRGGVLCGARLAYEVWGKPSGAQDNVLLIFTGLSANAHAASHVEDPTPGWWEAMLGPGKPIDTRVWHVICVNSLGSCKGSTGPSSLNPCTEEPFRLNFPELSIEDIADAAAFSVRAMGFESLACVIGVSMGGMTALSMITRHQGLARNHINISGAAHALPFSIALRSLQREAIRCDPLWNQGDYDGANYPEQGMIAARKLGVLSYRSSVEWDERFGRRRLELDHRIEAGPFDLEFAVEGYLERHARRFARNYDPNCYLYLSRCMDWFDLGESCDSNADEALSRLCLEKALIIGVQTDCLFPLHQQRQIAERMQDGGVDAKLVQLDSKHGHDAFLVDFARFGPALANFLGSLNDRKSESLSVVAASAKTPGGTEIKKLTSTASGSNISAFANCHSMSGR